MNDDTVACPVCGNRDLAAELEITAEEAAQHYVLREADRPRYDALVAHIRDLWGWRDAKTMRCGACDFGFAFPHVAGDERFYELAFGRSGYPADKWEYRRTLEAMDRASLGHGKALEVASGYGLFLRKISPSPFPPASITSLEYNAHARNLLVERGYRVEAKDVRELPISGARFEAIFMFQVLEHLDDPNAVFEALSAILEPGGHLFVAVPNPSWVRLNERTGSLVDMPPAHIGRWSREAFAHVARAHSLQIQSIEVEPPSVAEILKTDLIYSYQRRAQLRPRSVANWLYGRRKSPVWRIGNVAAIALYGLLRLPVWAVNARQVFGTGHGLWVHFRKP